MTREECKMGMVVRLAGGGPNLTVNYVFPADIESELKKIYCVQCTWFDSLLHKQVDQFDPATLVPVEFPHPYR